MGRKIGIVKMKIKYEKDYWQCWRKSVNEWEMGLVTQDGNWNNPMFKQEITNVCQGFTMRYNTPDIRFEIKHRLNVLFETFKHQNHIIDYRVKCNEENNPPDVIDNNNRLVVDMDLEFRGGVIKHYHVTMNGRSVRDDENFQTGIQIFSELDPYGEEIW
jgi:hypothetical protein